MSEEGKYQSTTVEVDDRAEEARKLQSQTAKSHGGHVPKASTAAEKQSEVNKIKSVDRAKDEETIVQGLMDKQGSKNMRNIDISEGTGLYFSEDTVKNVEQYLSDKKQEQMKEFEKTPHLANVDIPYDR